MIDRAVDFCRGPHAQRNGDTHGKDDRESGELERSGKPLCEVDEHRLPGR